MNTVSKGVRVGLREHLGNFTWEKIGSESSDEVWEWAQNQFHFEGHPVDFSLWLTTLDSGVGSVLLTKLLQSICVFR